LNTDIIMPREKTPVNLAKSILNPDLHKKMPVRTTDILTFKPNKEPGCSVLLDFNKRGGREDNYMYSQSEQYKNIINENKKSAKHEPKSKKHF